MAKQVVKMVHCRYPKCMKLHETTELNKDEAVKGGSKNSYYHPDCWHTMQTVNKIRDLFIQKIDSTLTGKQIGMLVSTINNIIFTKKVDVDFLEFAVEYFIKNKPGKLRYPAGLHYIIQDRDAIGAWEKLRKQKMATEMKQKMEQLRQVNVEEVGALDAHENKIIYKPQKQTSFADILR